MVSPVTLSSVASRAVRNTTGTRTPSPRSRRVTSKPSRSGSMMSRTISAGRNVAAVAIAARPVEATATSNPVYRNAVLTRSVMASSSSTTSTRAAGSTMASIVPRPVTSVVGFRAERDLPVPRLAVPSHRDRRPLPGTVVADEAAQVARARHRRPVDGSDEVSLLQAGLVGRLPVHDGDDEGATAAVVGVGRLHAQPPDRWGALAPPQPFDHALGVVDGDGEADALSGGRGVDADHLTGTVDQRAPGVPRVDGGVVLDQPGEVVEGAIGGRHDASRHGGITRQTECVADRHDVVADFHGRGVAELGRGQPA